MQPAAAPSEASNPIDTYLAGVPEPARTTLSKLRTLIRSVVPAETTETISYGIPTFKYKGPLVGFAAFPKHCSFFTCSGTLLQEFSEDVAKYPRSKGALRFPPDKPLPAALIKKLVKARIEQNEGSKRR
jgi:uncharacterized protein YdhG (YjbR/CyaY superfamily)